MYGISYGLWLWDFISHGSDSAAGLRKSPFWTTAMVLDVMVPQVSTIFKRLGFQQAPNGSWWNSWVHHMMLDSDCTFQSLGYRHVLLQDIFRLGLKRNPMYHLWDDDTFPIFVLQWLDMESWETGDAFTSSCIPKPLQYLKGPEKRSKTIQWWALRL